MHALVQLVGPDRLVKMRIDVILTHVIMREYVFHKIVIIFVTVPRSGWEITVKVRHY